VQTGLCQCLCPPRPTPNLPLTRPRAPPHAARRQNRSKPGNSLMKVLGRKGTRKGSASSDGGVSRGDSPLPSPESSVHEGAASPSSSIDGSEMEVLAGRVNIAVSVGGKQGDNSQ